MADHCVYLLSPANCAGKRAGYLLGGRSESELAVRLRETGDVTLGEAFTFMSGLYFRGKLAYATAFGRPPTDWSGAMVITPGRGLLSAETIISVADLRRIREVPVDLENQRYLRPLQRDIRRLAESLGDNGRAVLLGSIATDKYVQPLQAALGERLHFPEDFVGRGDMSRGGLMLRCAREQRQLTYIPLSGAPRRGRRPPRLDDDPRQQKRRPRRRSTSG